MSMNHGENGSAPRDGSGPADDLLVVGKVGKAKGVKGWARCRSFTDEPTDLAEIYRTWRLKDRLGRLTTWRVEDWRPTTEGDVLEVKLEGCDDRDLAMTLTNREIMVSRSEFPATEEEGSYYWVDLIGFTVRDADTGRDLGVMTGVMEQPSADVIEVEPPSSSSPFPSPSSSENRAAKTGDEKESGGTAELDDGRASDDAPAPDAKTPRRGGKSATGKRSRPQKTLIPWVWGVFVLAVDMEAKVIEVRWREGE